MSTNDPYLVSYISELDKPSFGLSFGGFYLEDEVPGYRTLSVTGRDSLEAEINEGDVGYNPGALFLNRKLPTRDIEVTYALVASTPENLRSALNTLRGILFSQGSEEVQIIFDDESDKYYMGCVSSFTEAKLVNNAASNGTFTIHCEKPFKWSVEEYEVAADDNGQILVDYDGTYPAFPTLKATVNSTLGFIGFVNDAGAIVQLGDPDELDYDTKDMSSTLINDDFVSNPGALASNWPTSLANHATVEQRNPVNRDTQVKTLQVINDVTTGVNDGEGVTRAFHQSTGSNGIASTSSTARYAGATRTQVLSERAANFVVTMNYILSGLKEQITNPYYGGEIRLLLTGYAPNSSTKISLASFHIYVGDSNANKIKINWSILDKQYKEVETNPPKQTEKISGGEFTVTESQAKIKPLAKTCSITKEGKTWTFNSAAGKWSKTLNGTEDYELSEISIWILGINKVSKLSATVKTPSQRFINGKTIEQDKYIESAKMTVYADDFPNAPTASKPIELTIWASKTSGTWVPGPVTKTTTTAKKTVKITAYDTWVNTGVLKTLVAVMHTTPSGITTDKIRIRSTAKDSNNYKFYVDGTFWTSGVQPARDFVDLIGVRSIKVVKNEYDVSYDVPNPFSAGDEVEAVCETGDINVNGLSNYQIGALGNDWETFYLSPGPNEVRCTYSDWAEASPEFSLTYRKVYI